LEKLVERFYRERKQPPRELSDLVRYGYIPVLPEAPPGKALLYDDERLTVRIVER